MKVKGVIFDMDGTLIESLTFWNYFYKKVGKIYLDNEGFMPSLEVNKNMRTMSFNLAMEYFVNACNLKATATEFIEFAKNELASFYKEVATVKKGAIELLDFLKEKGVKICLASATGLEEIKKVLAYHNLTSYFDSILSCAEVGVGKEKPDIYYLAARNLGFKPCELMVVEDSAVALETAKNAEFLTAGVYDENNFNHDRLKEASNVLYIDKDEDLTKIIKEIE